MIAFLVFAGEYEMPDDGLAGLGLIKKKYCNFFTWVNIEGKRLYNFIFGNY